MSNELTNDLTAPIERLNELAEAQRALDHAFAQLATSIPEREVRAVGQRVNDLLAAFARATTQRQSRLRDALNAIGPFEIVQGDAINRTNPSSLQKVNASEAWIVSSGSKSAHKLRQYVEILNENRNE